MRRRTASQLRFWESHAKFRLYRGGVGSGKTFAGCIEVFRQPPGSIGMVTAPTYPMLQDSTLRTFLDLARRGGILRDYLKGDRTAILAGGRTVLFRTADKPDRLRGPNLGWFYADEAALSDPHVWPILIGRLRLPPYRGWLTTSPRGNKNWSHTTFTKGGDSYDTIPASTRDAFWHPPEFVGSMEANYSADFARQEIDGEVLDDAQEGLLLGWWLDRLETVGRAEGMPPGPRRLGLDLGYGTGRDSFAAIVRDDLGILHGLEDSYVGVPQAAAMTAELSRAWGVRQEHIVYDAGGPGRDMARYLEAHRITEAVAYYGSGKGGPRAENRRSRVAWKLRQRLDPQRPTGPPADPDPTRYHPLFPPAPAAAVPQPPFALPAVRPWWPRLREELGELKYTTRARKVALETKEELAARLKRSPNLCDALFMTFDGEE